MEPGQQKNVDSVPRQEAFPEYRKEDLPGVSLLGARTKEGMTQTRLSERSGHKRFIDTISVSRPIITIFERI